MPMPGSARILLAFCLVGCSGAGAAAIGGGDPTEIVSGDDAASGPSPGTPPKQPHGNDGSTPPDPPGEEDAAPPTPRDGGTDAIVTADCGTAPSLHPSPEAGVYCPFQAVGAPSRCAIGTHCCVYPTNAGKVATCNPLGVACDPVEGTADFGCDEPADCPGAGQVCCLKGTVEKDPACYAFGKGVTATTCRPTACAVDEAQICSGSGQCPAGKTCVPFATRGKELGACR